ncbi:type VI secretion system ATPase TssH [Azospirillum sp. TSO22-1]|uniref:type VI secretion system ATPase TssH n=1 Tax=Azospirillum sp. TSO22-1 TaxID=716789 RepID=UPI000D619BE5|nr:type VI secretion system ATPase TssH [Azospirillum sp. TSO22-1]PWC54498.1 AAA family ATPase [Azospirillum sp. TSO22-1]
MSSLKPLIGKLNPTAKRALETAAQLCLTQTHFAVEVQHLLLKLAGAADSDVARLLRHYGVDAGQLAADLTRALEKLPRGNVQTPAFSEHLLRLLERAWVVSSLRLGGHAIRSGAILAALLEDDALRGMLVEAAPKLSLIPRGKLSEDLGDLLRGSPEDAGGPTAAPAPGASALASGTAPSKAPALDAYTIDLTAQARAGTIDPIVGRDAEIRQVVDVLMRRRQNNPILTGDPGVGKTAVVEGFAQQVADGAVPPPLRNVSVRILDLGLLQAGAGIKGEFENRLKQVIDEVAASPAPVILFIDEAHTLVGAGGPAGQGDAANLLKPALARGELRTIAATTWAEYKRYFEKDAALARRFQVVKVEEPDEPTATAMLRALVPKLEAHHRVRILDEAVADAVRLAHRYISDRQLPDKAIGVLDTACARVALAQSGPPPELQGAARRSADLTAELALLARESAAGREHSERMERLADERAAVNEECHRLESRWRQEAEVVARIRDIEDSLPARNGAAYLRARAELDGLRLELEQVQDDFPMVPTAVDHRAVAQVVAGWTGIPVGRMLTDNVQAVRTLRERMGERVVGQDAALDAVAKRIRTYFAGLGEPGKPTGVFLLVGPSGVGKTETALTLADLLFGGERSLVTINMSEYQEAHSVSGLKGAPPGYVGFGKGGVLTEAVRRTPYCVVLLDEVEKAHADVLELFYQVFDKGTLEDSEGVVVDFKNTIILLTSNLGTDTIARLAAEPSVRPLTAAPLTADSIAEAIRPDLVRRFKPALLGRMVVVPYLPLGENRIRDIVRLKLARVQARFAEAHGAELTYDDAVVAFLADRCRATDAGARAIDHLLTNTLLPELSGGVLERLADGMPVDLVHVDLDASDALRYTFGMPAHRVAGP